MWILQLMYLTDQYQNCLPDLARFISLGSTHVHNVSIIFSEVCLSDTVSVIQSKLLDTKQKLPESLLWWEVIKWYLHTPSASSISAWYSETAGKEGRAGAWSMILNTGGNYVMAWKSILSYILLLAQYIPYEQSVLKYLITN